MSISPVSRTPAPPFSHVTSPSTPSADRQLTDLQQPPPRPTPLAEVKRELKRLNLCGGVTNSADAAPVIASSGAGFIADPGTSQTEGQLPTLTVQLNSLGKALGVTIYGISGYRTPAHSVAVGGFADDPHTKGQAEDIGVNSLLRSSAAQISEAELGRFGLYRPFDPSDDPNNTEVNHIQLTPKAASADAGLRSTTRPTRTRAAPDQQTRKRPRIVLRAGVLSATPVRPFRRSCWDGRGRW